MSDNIFLVSFPKLGLDFNVNPDAFEVFGRDIKWYAIIILTGIILAVLFAIWEGKRTGVSVDTILDIVLICVPVSIICARAYYVAFEWKNYNNFWEMIQIWNGGIAIYGAIIGACTSAVIYCLVKKISMGELFDLGGFGFLIGQSIGRWGNFMNGEAYGGPTGLPWGMLVEYETSVPVHPTFLYESLWNLIGFVILFFYRKHKKFSGEIFWLYVVWYGLGRVWVEGLRADSLYIWNTQIRISQLVAAVAVVAGVSVIAYKRFKLKNKS